MLAADVPAPTLYFVVGLSHKVEEVRNVESWRYGDKVKLVHVG